MMFSFTNFITAEATLNETFPQSANQIWQFVENGGFFMALIILCSLLSITIIIQRALALRKPNVVPGDVVDELSKVGSHYVKGSDTSPLQGTLSESNTTLSRIAQIALSGNFSSKSDAADTVQSHAREEVVKLQWGLAALEVVITIAPLLGLLGTVSGLVSVFSTLGEGSAEEADHAEIAKGIAEALNTTIAGLAVAVPTVIAHSYFSKKIERMAVRMEVIMGKLLNQLG